MEGQHESRYHSRFESVHLVQFTHFDETFRKDIEDMGRTLDISEGGIMLECKQTLPAGTQVELNIAIDEKIITVRGEIVHVMPAQGTRVDIGVKFTLITKKDKQLINDFVSSLENRPTILSHVL